MQKRIIAGLKMWLILMTIIFVPIGAGVLVGTATNEIAGIIVWVSAFLLASMLAVTLTADWVQFENKRR